MAWTYVAYLKNALPAYTAQEGTQIGDLERMIYDAEFKYARCALAIIQVNADTRLTSEQKQKAVLVQTALMTALEAQKAVLIQTLTTLKGSLPQ